MGKKVIFFIILTIVCLVVVVIAAVLFSSKLRYFLYKEISYQYLADNITRGAKSDEKKVLRIFDYIHDNLSTVGSQVIDKDAWNDLLRGIAWCDQQSWDFATLLSKKNITARIVMLKDKDGVSPHTVAEVFLQGRWIVLDPLNGLVLRKNDGALVTLEEISEDPSIISQNSKVKALPQEKQGEFILWYGRMFPLPREPKKWGPLLEKKNRSLPQKIVNQTINFLVKFLNGPFVNIYQDLYLSIEAKSFREKAEKLYFRARNYQLYNKTKIAEETYNKLIQNYPNSEYAENSQFFLAVLYLELKRDYKTAIEKFNKLFEKYPNTKWSILAHYFLGKAYEVSGDLEKAKINYSFSSVNLDTDAAWRLSNIRVSREYR